MRWVELGVLRHACLQSGGCCQDARVRLGEDEASSVAARAAELGLTDTLGDDGTLAKVDGRCVMLGSDGLCRLHATFGAEAKPAVCRQFPWVAVRVASDVRIGVDPACSSAWRTQDGEATPPRQLVVARVDLPEALERQEAGVLAALEGEETVAGALASLGLTPRWETWRELLASRSEALQPALEAGAPAVRVGLLPQARSWPEQPAGAPTPSAERDRWAVEAARRMVGLRLTEGVLPPSMGALMTLYGAGASSWRWPVDDAAFSRGFSAWLRALRSPVFVSALLTDGRGLRALVG